MPLVITEEQVKHLRRLLEQTELWVGRARWNRWLAYGNAVDGTRIEEMGHDDRIAACSWLRQQRHVLHDTIEGGFRAPDGWVESLPLYDALCVLEH